MLEIRRDFDLRLETVHADDRAEIGPEHLEGNATIVAQVPSEEDPGHAPFSDQSLDRVAIGEGRCERVSREHPAALLRVGRPRRERCRACRHFATTTQRAREATLRNAYSTPPRRRRVSDAEIKAL